MLTVQNLAQAISDELEARYWGDIDPRIFKTLGQGGAASDSDDEHWRDVTSMYDILEAVIRKLELNK